MGLMDILNGMQNGPRGQQQPEPAGSSSGGMPTWMMALLGLLAYKAIKGGGLGNMLGGSAGSGAPTQPMPDPRMDQTASTGGIGDILGGLLGGGAGRQASPGGGLGGLLGGAAGGGLGGMLGGLLGGGAAGGMLNGGLGKLVEDLQQNGQGDAVKSWVGSGDNQSISQSDLAKAIGVDDIDAVAQQTGLPRDQILSSLQEHLPEFVNKLTPHGRLPTEDEASRWV